MENTVKENIQEEEVERVVKSDSKIREEYLKRLDKDVMTAEIRKENLESQVHSLQIRLDGERKLVEQEKLLKFADEKKRLATMDNELHVKKEQAELKEVHLKDREKSIAFKEENYAKFMEEKNEFNKSKILFQEYKTKIESELREAKINIAEINAKWSELESEREVLDGIKKTLSDKEDDLDIQAGLLAQKQKDFEIYKQGEINKYTTPSPDISKEVVNA